jgi:hypothetical protein
MGIMPDPKHQEQMVDPFAPLGMDTSESIQSEDRITVNQLATVIATLQGEGFGESAVTPMLVGPDGTPLAMPLTIVGAGYYKMNAEAILLVFPGTKEEWQG